MDDAPPPSRAEDLRALALVIHDLSWRIARFGPAQVGVTPLPASELAVLRTVMDQPGRSVSEVAQSLAMQQSNASAAVRSLVERGLVDKRPDANDRRISLLEPTPRALSERSQIEDAIAATVSAALETLSADHAAALREAVPAMQALTEQVGVQAWRL
ncbi:MarR family winged helix-turn-helix transcriptional regulator [Mycobacterium sp. SMC-4]|uniref:MarR family winged helix-turn-helix transcriptional regulator n=1 Tax=Mycobacterium sp. SMC-4 TaxID=2857059 RepID=UPI003D02C8E2